jgi:predicted hotdog family 3-hydroxylacyl-ACP dehydratase
MNSLPTPAQLLPHAEPMVLIDSVEHWDQQKITCRASSHRSVDNPLRCSARLSIYAGLEYAAQAMAAHAKLLANSDKAPRRGFIATASKIVAHEDRLDGIAADLDIEARQTTTNGDSSLYEFTITGAGQLLLEGQLMVVKQAEGL